MRSRSALCGGTPPPTHRRRRHDQLHFWSPSVRWRLRSFGGWARRFERAEIDYRPAAVSVFARRSASSSSRFFISVRRVPESDIPGCARIESSFAASGFHKIACRRVATADQAYLADSRAAAVPSRRLRRLEDGISAA